MNRLLRLGLPRDPSATTHLAGFVVSAVVTVLLTRAFLAAAGYPTVGSGGLHVAHVLWGGLLMAAAFVVLLSFAGPVARPVGALLGGVGFGLFVDEIGKFVTADNDYFYGPTASLIYAVVVLLVVVSEALHGRLPHDSREYLAGAVDQAVAGVAGGFTPRARADARGLVARAGDVPGAREARALLDAIDDDPHELPNPINAVGAAVVRVTHRLVAARWVPWITVAVLVASLVGSVAMGLAAWWGGADQPGWVVVGLLVSAAGATALAGWGLLVVRQDRREGYLRFRWAVLVSLLVVQVFVFRLREWSAVAGLVVELAVAGLVAAELQQVEQEDRRRRRAPAPGPEGRRGRSG
ncbi:hypothetical protein [Actinotalea fermentans]|uniref:Uncharacterized protein n=1 Tax=Actinotalea fermentans TaxID=43671 RepID=A0A511YUY1_9CELL|nr:hypothetical protein [Actinotalea fermentans]KGM17897.1 hypothetical protein N867_00150 [Actinotalea fermentans ATCC 43279 = JCM 9966 = DSM 3133]GEN79007.1 hypothetical protein AFE02nite_07410 [Actinotalea fermentans]